MRQLRWSWVCLCVVLWSGASAAWSAVTETRQERSNSDANWIWAAEQQAPRVLLRREFAVGSGVTQVRLAATCDDQFQAWINGQKVLTGDAWQRLESADVTAAVNEGTNVLVVEGVDRGGARGFICRLDLISASGRTSVVSDPTWRGRPTPAGDVATGPWHDRDFDDTEWPTCQTLGTVGGDGLPWNGSVDSLSLAEAVGVPTPPVAQVPQVAENVTSLPGFKVEKLVEVPRSMGSWVALTTGRDGVLIASDQGGAGLYEIKPAPVGDPAAVTQVSKIPVNFSSAQGLLWKDDGMFAVRNGSGSGLYRLSDTDADGKLDQVTLLKGLQGGGEHGPHAVLESPDGQSLVVIGGNHTQVPEGLASSRLPRPWAEDLLLPRRWDANGHAAGILAPGGWIAQVDPAGQNWELWSAGYRNQYDMAFNADGELFTYDADMEWDLGSPWYRPTRVNHATSGSEMGWRSGTGKWPVDYEDSLPPVVDIGPGSPVGVAFGYGSRFPAKYQRALYLLDWTYSTIYACHLTPDGASYTGEVEDFVFGQPLQVTDAVVGQDGALYFTAGGRGTRSSLYRISYEGGAATDPVDYRDPRGDELRRQRRQLEAFHQPGPADMNAIWDGLGHADRFIRYAARVALEHRPVEAWRTKALEESDPRTALTALMALARMGAADDLSPLLKALERIDLKGLDGLGRVTWLRNHQLAFTRLGAPSPEQAAALAPRLESLFASVDEPNFRRELIQVLVYLQSPRAVELGLATLQQLEAESEPVPAWSRFLQRNAGYGGTVQAMLDQMPPVQALHYAFVLRNAEVGWTPARRLAYLQFFSRAAQHPGGASFPGFLSQSRADALAKIPVSELPLYDEVLSVPLGRAAFVATPPQGPGRVWTVSDALSVAGQAGDKPNFDRGRNLFHAANCAKCHRMAGEGGAIGPDLSTAGRKFSLADMLEAIVEPSKAISDQYGSHQIMTVDGQVLVGRVVEVDKQFHVYTADVGQGPVVLSPDDIDEMTPSKVSQMPAGTVDELNPKELRELLAFLMSGGDPKAAIYQ
jgi:putative heme-binding domain-containing protein